MSDENLIRFLRGLEHLRALVEGTGDNMDNKYGHLFTSEDMIAFARIVAESGIDIYNDDAVDEMLDDFDSRFPKDEPLFLLRGQDRQALSCVRNYRTMTAFNRHREAPPELLTGLDAVVMQFEDFQTEHPDRIKDAD